MLKVIYLLLLLPIITHTMVGNEFCTNAPCNACHAYFTIITLLGKVYQEVYFNIYIYIYIYIYYTLFCFNGILITYLNGLNLNIHI